MDVNKLGQGQRIAAGAAVLLFIDMLLNWYSAGAGGFSVSVSAWEVFSWVDLLLLATILVALGAAAQAMGMLSIPVRLSNVLLPLAALTTLIVLYRLVNQPGPNDIVNNEFGAYLGFVLAAAVTYGALRAQDEGEAVSPRPTAGTTTAAPTPPPAAPSPAASPSTTPGATPPPAATPPADDEDPVPPSSSTP